MPGPSGLASKARPKSDGLALKRTDYPADTPQEDDITLVIVRRVPA